MSLAGTARETVAVIERGGYARSSGDVVDIAPEVARMKEGTRLWQPAQLEALASAHPQSARARIIEVTGETTARATQRLVIEEGARDVACLNFASAKRPGGGFLGGARAQEEDLARRSALYASLVTKQAAPYYVQNRACGTALYTDHMIWSPGVPFFRDDTLALVDHPWTCGVLTAPAPNAGAMLRRAPDAQPEIQRALARRARYLIEVLAHSKQSTIVLGAWGCGVFKNDPVFVAGVFADLLLGSSFERVVFAVCDRTPERRTLNAFRDRLGGASGAAPS